MLKYTRVITKLFGFTLLGLGLAACKGPFNTKLFKERAAETPAPSEEVIDKSFFVNADGKPKTFLCAWAPEMGRGWLGERFHTLLVNETPHCNVEFEITQGALIGKRIHPSFPNDRNRWDEILRIPIEKHFYYEREKDQHGRDTNKWIENDTRSHWSARPKFKLNLGDISMPGLTSLMEFLPGKTTAAYEVEWDHNRGFLGFSIDTNMLMNLIQGKMRVNFLEFKHDPTFKKIPYHQENSRFMNILHVMGRKVEGVEPELYASRWDLRKTHTIYLNGVPKEHQKTVLAAIDKWNETFRRIGAIGPKDVAFKGEVANLKHPFDLRYPTFNWISDIRLSQWSPLGIGMAHADVRNGQILWGSVNLYGGMLEHYVNRYTAIASSAANGHGGPALSDSMNPIKVMSEFFQKPFQPVRRLEQLTVASRPSLAQSLVNLAKQQPDVLDLQLKKMQALDPRVTAVIADLTDKAHGEMQQIGEYFKRMPTIQHLGSSLLKKAALEQPTMTADKRRDSVKKLMEENDLSKRAALLRDFDDKNRSFVVEEGLNVANLGSAWMNASARKQRTLPELLESVIMDLSLHEVGHFLGLGHQFKENIVPEEGTVPSRFVKDLAEKSTAERGFINYTSVMGYRHGKTEMTTTSDEMAPGPHDELVLRYLYKGEYAAYDKDKDDFIFGKVPTSGKIPTVSQLQGQGAYPTAYFPQCNDYEASLGADPFCNRWDRGSTAQDIVKNYFENISDNLLTNLYSLVGGSGNAEGSEAMLWYYSLDAMSRVRLFYDEMRRRLRSEPELKPLWNQLRSDKNALLEFAQACQQADPTGDQVRSEVLRKIFAHKDILDLCRANLIALNEYRFFLNLPNSDYTRIDHKNRYISGGYLEGDAGRNWGQIFGTWYQLSNLPLKITALYTLTTAHPYHLWWGAYLGPNYYYDHEENRFLYRTLYPREYTKLISEGVQHNMRFEATGHSDTTGIGRTILAAGSMLPWMRYTSNDSARLPKDYTDLLDQQTEFQYSAVAVIIKPTKPDSNSNVKADHYKKFTATIFDFFTGRTTNARDVYILPNGNVLVWANGMFIYPITELKFFSGNESYVIAYKIAYGYKPGDELVEDSVKAGLLEKHNAVLSICVDGFAGNGLTNYFDSANPDFEGFLIPPLIAEEAGNEKMDLFHKSVDAAFAKYDVKVKADGKIPAGFPIKSMRQVCDRAVRGVGQIAASAALINGFWLGITADYLEK